MKISDLTLDQIKPGLKIRSLVSARTATVVRVDHADDDYVWVRWEEFEGDPEKWGGWYGTDCNCEIIE